MKKLYDLIFILYFLFIILSSFSFLNYLKNNLKQIIKFKNLHLKKKYLSLFYSQDSVLEAFSHNPTDDSIATLFYQTIT